MKGSKAACSLLMLMAACMGCRAPVHVGASERTRGITEEQVAIDPARLPDALTGVWYPVDAEGVTKCERFRALSSKQKAHDEAIAVLVGSLVVTTRLIHVFREYGEGDFHVIEKLEPDGGDAWRITTRLGIDALPDDEESERDRVVSLISLRDGELQWQSPVNHADFSTYSRCDAVPPDIHPPMNDGSAVEAVS